MRTKTLVFLFLVPSLVFAGNNRSAVSINGSDLNPCTTAAPCRSFTTAMGQTNAGGEIIAIDSAGYGPFTITQAVTVSGAPGIHAAITAVSGDAIGLNASGSDLVSLRNLVLIGNAAANGIAANGIGTLQVTDVTIRGFDTGILFTALGVLALNRSEISGNGDGISVFGGSASINDSQIIGNGNGATAEDDAKVSVSHSVISKNDWGVVSQSTTSGHTADMFVDGCSIILNNVLGVLAGGAAGASRVRLSNSVVFGNSTGVQAQGGGTVFSYGNNKIDGNALADVALGTTLTTATAR